MFVAFISNLICSTFQDLASIGAGQVFGFIPIPAVILLIIFALILVLMNYTKFGCSVYAVGGNPESARLSGINVKFVKTAALVIVHLPAALYN